jgi:hypothetical protein
LELAYQAPLKKLEEHFDVSDVTYVRGTEDFEYRLACKLNSTANVATGIRYRKIVQKCLDCDFGCGYDLWNEDLQTAFYREIILELQDLEKKLMGLQAGNGKDGNGARMSNVEGFGDVEYQSQRLKFQSGHSVTPFPLTPLDMYEGIRLIQEAIESARRPISQILPPPMRWNWDVGSELRCLTDDSITLLKQLLPILEVENIDIQTYDELEKNFHRMIIWVDAIPCHVTFLLLAEPEFELRPALVNLLSNIARILICGMPSTALSLVLLAVIADLPL